MTALTPALAQPEPLPNPTTVVKDVSGLVSPPDICMRVIELMRSATASAQDFGTIISQDPNLTTRLLRMVNSSFYGFASRIDTVSRAIAVIGTQELYNLVISVSAVQSFSKISSDLVDMDSFWRHSVGCGLMARRLSQHCGVLHPERLFVAGLLHEIGSLVLFHQFPAVCEELLDVCQGDEEAMCRGEYKRLGYSHAEIGSLLLTLWNLPPALPGAIRGHHTPSNSRVGKREASIVKAANRLANQTEFGCLLGEPANNAGPDPLDWDAIGLKQATVETLIEDVAEQFSKTYRLIVSRS